MIQKITLTLFLLLNFITNIFASGVVFEFQARDGSPVAKLYLGYGSRLFYNLTDKNGNILPSNNLSFEAKNMNTITSIDNFISVFPYKEDRKEIEIIVKYNGQIIKKQTFATVHLKPIEVFLSYDGSEERKVDISKPVFVSNLFLSYQPDEDFEKICGKYNITLFASIVIIRNGEILTKQNFVRSINLRNENIRPYDRIKITITGNSVLRGSGTWHSHEVAKLLNTEFEFVVR